MSFEERQRQVFASIAKILIDCIKPTVPWMKDLLTQLCDEDGITEEDQSRLRELLTDVGIQDVMKLTLELAEIKDDGLGIFKSVLVIDEALEVSDEAKKISELVLGNWKDKEAANLILLWDELSQNKDYATSIATKIWTESHAICDGDGNWPQDFICFCLATSERTKIAEFVTSFSLGQTTTFTHEQEAAIAIKDCLLQIFTHCLDSKMMIKLIVKLRGEGALTKEQKKSLVDQAKSNSIEVTALEMIDVVGHTEHGFQYFADVFQEGEIPLAEKFKEVVIATVQHDLELQQMKLILLWAELIDHSSVSKRRIEELWQDVPGLVDDDWPLNFIHFCITRQGHDVEKVEMLVNDIADVKMRFQIASEPSENEAAYSIADFMGEDDVSFVIVNEDEFTDDNMQSMKQPDDAEHEPYIPPNINETDDKSRIASSKGMDTDQGADGDIVTINDPADEELEENRSRDSSTFTNGSNSHLGMKPATDQGKEAVDRANEDLSGMDQPTTTSIPGSEGQEKMIVQPTLHGVQTDDGDDDETVTIRKPTHEVLEENLSWHSSECTDGPWSHSDTKPVAERGEQRLVDQANEDASGTDHATTTSTPSSEGQEELINQPTSLGGTTHEENGSSAIGGLDSTKDSSARFEQEIEGTAEKQDELKNGEEHLVDQANEDASGTDQTTTTSTPGSEGQEELINHPTSHGEKAHEENGSRPIGSLISTKESSAYTEQEIEGTAEEQDGLENGNEAGIPGSEESTDEESTTCSRHSTDDLNSHSDAKPVTYTGEEHLVDQANKDPSGTDQTTTTSTPGSEGQEELINQPTSHGEKADEGLSHGSRQRDPVLPQPESQMHDLIAHQQQLDEILAQSKASDNTNMDGQPMTVEFRVMFKLPIWISEGWEPHLLLCGVKHQRMKYVESEGYYHFEMLVHGDQHELYYSYGLVMRTRTGNRYIPEYLPKGDPMRYTLFIRGVNQTMLDIATFSHNESRSGWMSLMAKTFHRFLPNTSNHTKPIKLIHNEIQAWFEVAYLGWQFNTAENKSYQEKLQTEKVEKITDTWLQSLMKSENKKMLVACSVFVVVAMEERKRHIKDNNLLKTLANGLQIQGMDEPIQQTLYKDLNFIIEKRKLINSLEEFLKMYMNGADVSLILTLPLYALIFWDGNVATMRFEIYALNSLEERALLPKSINWRDFRKSVQENTYKHNKLSSLSRTIMMLSDTHPYIVDTYHYFLPLSVMIKLIKKKDEVCTKFQIDSIFSQILPFFKTDNRQNLTSIMTDLSLNLTERFKDHIKAANTAGDYQREASKKKAKYLLKSIVDEIKWYGNKVKNFDQFKQKCSNWLLSMATHCFSWLHELSCDPSDLDKLHSDILQSVRRMIHNYDSSKDTDVRQLELYNALIGQCWYYDEFQYAWQVAISLEIGQCIDKKWKGVDGEYFLGFYAKIAKKKFQSALDVVLENKVSDCLLGAVKSMGKKAGSKLPTSVVNLLKMGVVNPFATAIEKTLEKYWDESPTMQSLKFLANSEMALMLYQAFDHENLSLLIKSATSTKFCQLHKEAHSIVERMQRKELTLKEMKFIIDNKERMAELLSSIEKKASDSGSAPTSLEIKLMMETNEEIVTSYHQRCAAISSFIEFCTSLLKYKITVDCGNLTGLIRDDARVSLQEAEHCNPEDTYLNEMNLILLIQNCKMLARARRKVATNYYKSAQETSLTINVMIKWEEALRKIWKDVRNDLNNLIRRLQIGSLENKEISREFKDFKQIPQELEEEIKLLISLYKNSTVTEVGELTRTASDLATAVSHVFTRERQEKVINWLVEFKTKYKISGDFGIFEEKNLLKRNLDELSNLEIILSITREELKILEDFSVQSDLIKWLQDYPNGKEGLEALCLVAGEASRYNVEHADRWSMLKESIIAFEDLLFDINAISCVNDLMSRCRRILRNVNDGNGVMVKWSDTGKHLSWYKENAGNHGSEEISALEFARKANREGIYVVGKLLGTSVPNLAKSVRMQFNQTEKSDTKALHNDKENMDTDPQPEDKEITIDKLHDYESILTLITNDGEKSADEIIQYIETLTAIERLAKAYVNLINAGFILFSRWNMKISCSLATGDNVTSERILTTWMTFNDGEGNLGGDASITDINMLSDEMNKALSKWENHISDMRLRHYHLNEYNIQQIKYLCENLGKTQQHTFEDQVYLLLSNAPRQSLVTHLRDSLKEALTLSISGEDTFDLPQADQTLGQDEVENRKKQQAVRYLVLKEHMSEKLAKAAVQAEGHERLTDCINWVVLNEYDDEEVNKQSREFDRAIEFVLGEADTQEDASVLRDTSVTSVAGMIAHLQRRANQVNITSAVKTIITGYLTSTTGVAMKDHLSVHHLGVFLAILRQKLGEVPIPRFLGYPFHRGIPNLIITEKEVTIPTALSLYYSDTESQLPNSNEVLLCSENTTEDEVERFLLRAMCRCTDKQKNCQSEETSCEMQKVVHRLVTNEQISNELAKASVQANGCVDVTACAKWAKFNGKEANEVSALSDEFDRTVGAGPIFCIISLENLEFNVWKALDMKYETLANSSHNSYVNDRYQLVLITSSGNHHAAMPFIKYQLAETPIISLEDIDSFVKREMTRDGIPKQPYAKVMTSEKAGMGKSLHVARICEELPQNCKRTTVRLLDNTITMQAVIQKLTKDQATEDPKLIHIDISQAVENDMEKFIFDLLILGRIKDKAGKVWRRRKNHSYVVEVTKSGRMKKPSHTLDLLPTITAISPKEVLECLKEGKSPPETLLMDEKEHQSDAFQRTIHYLWLNENNHNMSEFTYDKSVSVINERESMEILLRHCGILNPTWAQLKHFVSFLNVLLKNCENSSFLKASTGMDWRRGFQGFKELSVKFMIKMARDFATPSLVIADESSEVPEGSEDRITSIHNYQMRRKWEEQDHSYIFFNDDGHTMTFINVNIDKNGNLKDKDDNILEKGIANRRLVSVLEAQGFKFGFCFQDLKREDKLGCLCNIMGIEKVVDPDESYELTTDNVLKMIAIYMRLRCGIPVIVMGETGCGKTRMIEFISKLQAAKYGKEMQPVNGSSEGSYIPMRTLKVHGGIQASDIYKSVQQSLKDSKSILFFDEANTTTAIYAIKEVMCDLSVDGDIFQRNGITTEVESKGSPIQVIAACNPYKKLSNEVLSNLEKSGLGYRIPKHAAVEKFGNMAMRMLVYRVVALPQSIQPFVWDFGQLSEETEMIYIRNMISKAIARLGGISPPVKIAEKNLIVEILSEVQSYIRNQDEECRHVSLRDIERSIVLLEWFLKHFDDIFPGVDHKLKQNPDISKILRCLIHAIGISYHVSLNNRLGLRKKMSDVLFKSKINFSASEIATDYQMFQKIFHRDLKLAGKHIAWNEALRENVLLMAVCADTKLPLYIIGKPGSSKSLAKSMIDINMKGKTSTSKIFKTLTQVEMHSYQCSAQTNAAGIEGVFALATHRQKQRDQDNFTSLVVLDEIGLAEDSPNMPLKILHPLLECGNAKTGTLTEFDPKDKVAFVGISNWALDPAKMNRGIFVTRSTPLKDDLFDTANAICEGDTNRNYTNLDNLTKTYLNIYENQGDQFFGLRDYYSMIKMIHSANKDGKDLSSEDLAYILKRNFSGGSKKHNDVVEGAVYREMGMNIGQISDGDGVSAIINESVSSPHCSSRFLLLLTKHYSAIHLLHYILPDFKEKAHILFGSSFPGDHTYNELCKAIKKVKACIEQGRLVVSLNMADIHESLYDVLNQHYLKVGTQDYVAIGLGSHRVWTRVHENFRMIFIEKEEVAHISYPIPLLNRLEKHHLTTSGLLNDDQIQKRRRLSKWVDEYSEVSEFTPTNSFLGFHEDTISSVILMCPGTESPDIEEHKDAMLQMATPDSVFRLPKTKHSEVENSTHRYMDEQIHGSLFNLLKQTMETNTGRASQIEIFEVVSFSSILTEGMRKDLESSLRLPKNSVMLISLQLFKVMLEYTRCIEQFFKRSKEMAEAKKHDHSTSTEYTTILLIQSSQAHRYGQLIECAKYQFNNKLQEEKQSFVVGCKMIIVFILSTERKNSSLCLQPTRAYKTVYVDELGYTKSNTCTTLIGSFYQKSLVEILEEGKNSKQQDNFVLCILQDCIVDAVSKLDDPINMNGRQVDRIRILREITSGNASNDPDMSHEFLRILFQIMSITCRESSTQEEIEHWICNEALSKESLQEGGTFGKTIHLRLKREVSRILATVINVIDVNGNLNILIKRKSEMNWKCELWLRIFESYQFQSSIPSEIEYSEVASRVSQSKTPCKFPFSSVLTKMLYEMYTDASKRQNTEQFFYHQIDTSTKKVISVIMNAWSRSTTKKEQEDMMKSYAYDLISAYFSHLNMNEKDSEAITDILHGYAMQQWYDSRHKNGFGLTFFLLMKLEEQFKTILQIIVIYPEIKNQVERWINDQQKQKTFKTHTYALQSLLDEAYKTVIAISDEDSCMKWMSTSALIRHTYHSSLDMIECIDEKKDLMNKWKPLGLLDILLMRLLPWNVHDPDHKKYLKIVVKQAMRLLTSTESRGFHSMDVLKIITSISRKAYEQLKFNLIINWQDPASCVCSNELEKAYQMPCNKFVCEKCATNAAENTRLCPACYITLDEHFRICPAELSTDQTKKLDAFKANCTGFFLMYLREYCFNDEGDVDLELKAKAIFRSTIYTNGMSTTSGKLRLETNQLDLNIATKSIILGLLKARQEEIYSHDLNETIRSKSVNYDLIATVLRTLAAEYSATLSGHNIPDKTADDVKSKWKLIRQDKNRQLNAHALYGIAVIRFTLTEYVKSIDQHVADDDNNNYTSSLILRVEDMSKRDDFAMLKQFIVQVGLVHYGTNWFDLVRTCEHLKAFTNVTPQQKSLEKIQLELWTAFGDEYSNFIKEIDEGNATLDFPSNMQNVNIAKVLAIAQRRPPALTRQLQSNLEPKWRYVIEMKEIFFLNAQRITGFTIRQNHEAYKLVTSAVAVVLSEIPLVKELQMILTDPTKSRHLFWPAMPRSLYHKFNSVMDGEVPYRCPKGHVYYIGDCTYPWVKSKCPECGCIIGGASHRVAKGNQRLETSEPSGKCYQLHEEVKCVEQPGNRITPQAAEVIQFFIHSCMIVALLAEEPSHKILRILGKRSTHRHESFAFLLQKLWGNVRSMSKYLGCTVDDGVLLLQEIIVKMSTQTDNIVDDTDWSTEENCDKWEQKFRELYLCSVFHEADDFIVAAKKRMNTEEVPKSVVQNALNQTFTYQNSSLWQPLRDATTEHLMHSIIDSPESGAVLKAILTTPDLQHVKKLKDLLKLQEILISKYQNTHDMKDVEKITFSKLNEGERNDELRRLIDQFLVLWNQMYQTLLAKNSGDLILQDNMREISVESPITIAIPHIRGKGRCAKRLAEYLINTQNDFLHKCLMQDESIQGIAKVEVSKLQDSHFVCVDKQKDLLPMIGLHTSYSKIPTPCGTHHRITYNIPALEKQVKEEHVIYKRRILKESLPCIRYADTGIGQDWDIVKESIPQEPLSQQAMLAINEQVGKTTLAEICEGVRTLTQAISFLAKLKTSGNNGNRKLCDYLQKDLMLTAHHVTMIPRSTQIIHTLALYQKLTWHRAVRFVQQGLDPYKEYFPKDNQVYIKDQKLLKELKNCFENMDIGSLQERINEMLIKTDFSYFKPEWSLKYILPELEYLQVEDDDSLYEKLPEEIHLKHVADLFRLSVEGIPNLDHNNA